MMIEELLAYLKELRHLNEEGMYNCHKEIAEVITAIRKELGLSEEKGKVNMVVREIDQNEAQKFFEEVEKMNGREVKVIKR